MNRIGIVSSLPADWRKMRFRYFATTTKGRLPIKNDNQEADIESVPYLSMEYLRGDSEASILVSSEGVVTASEQDILLLWDGSNAGEFLRAKFGVVSSTVALVRPTRFDRKFLFWICKAAEPVVKTFTNGMGIPHVDGEFLKDLVLPYPKEVETQNLIANYLDRETARIDRLIAEKERMLALLEEKRSALISRLVTRGLNPDAPLKPSGQEWLGDIPAHWELWRMKHLAFEAISYGANEAALEDNPDWPRFVRITDVAADGSLRDETFKSLSPEIAKPFLLDDGDLLFARSGATVGKSFVYKPSWGLACFAGYLVRLRCDINRVLPDYLNFYARSQAYWHQVSTGMIQTTIQNFSAEKYAEIVVPLPPISEQEDIVEALAREQSQFDVLITEISSSLALMKERRAALITAAVTGKISIETLKQDATEGD